MDVKDYESNNLSVKVMGDSELVIEGDQSEKTDGASTKCKTFKRSFKFPGMQSDNINAVLSSDGIFTVNVPITVSNLF